MLSFLKSVGTGALLAAAKMHGGSADLAATHNNLPKFEAQGDSIAPHLQHLVNSAPRRALYDYGYSGTLPYCNEVLRNSDGETRGQRYGKRNYFGQKTCEGPVDPYCGQRLETGEIYADRYRGNSCISSNGDNSGYGSGVGYRGTSGYGYSNWGWGKKK